MTKRQRVEKTYRYETPDRIPFVPAVYEHKAALIGKSASAVCRNPDWLLEALHKEMDLYDPDMLTVGVDVYNVEAEALGARVTYSDEPGFVPAVVDPLLKAPSDLGKLRLPDPGRDGRMPLLVRVAEAAHREMGADLIVRGALTGPFSMACELAGTETLLLASMDEPEFLRRLLEFASQVTAAFGEAFLEKGVEVIIFDSRATPAVSSPRVFHDFIVPVYRDLIIPRLKTKGAHFIPLIIGGNTTSVIEDLIATGADQLLCDAGSDLEEFKRRTSERRRAFRANVDTRTVHRGTEAEIRAEALRILNSAGGRPGFLLGCGVVAYDCRPSHVLAIRRALEDWEAERSSGIDRS